MPQWAGKWQGGRFYVDELGRRVFFIERRKRVVKLDTHDERLAVGELARFLVDPAAFSVKSPTVPTPKMVLITPERVQGYLGSIKGAVEDHRKARLSYLRAWGNLGLDLRTVDRTRLRDALAGFDGGHAGRTEALNAFARWLVREGELATWVPLTNPHETKATRAVREAYSLAQLRAAFTALEEGRVRDVFLVRAATGMHHTEIEQIEGAAVTTGPLPDKGVAIREFDGKHEIAGVVQVVHRKKHKKERRHRVSVDADVLAAVLRLRTKVPDRITVWEKLDAIGITPSNLRHTFVTLAGEVGRLVTYKAAGVDRNRIAQVVGHREGSTMTPDRYDKLQVPPMIVLPLSFRSSQSPSRRPRRGRGASSPSARSA